MEGLLLVLYIVVFPGLLFLLAYAFFLQFLDRKIGARMQARVGPPLLQPFADFVKLLGKEAITPEGVDPRDFDWAPLVAFAAVATAFLYIPVIGGSPLAFQGDLVFVLYLLTVPTIVLFALGWLTRNVFATLGGVRAVTQLFIYEVPFFLALLSPGLMAGSWSITEIVAWQSSHVWLVLVQPLGFVLALVGLQAKLERTPFDIPAAETEIVAGPWTELTGRRLAVMQLAMDLTLVVGCALVAALFLGGPSTPWTAGPAWLAASLGFGAFLAKTLGMLLVLSALRVAMGRVRLDQLNDLGWKYLASLALVQVFLVLLVNAGWPA